MTRSTPSPRHTGRLIAAIAMIPLVSVTGVAFLGDVASGSSPGHVGLHLAALGAGLASGLLALRAVRSVRDGLAVLARALVHPWCNGIESVAAGATGFAPWSRAVAPSVATVPSAVRRRGPPVVLR